MLVLIAIMWLRGETEEEIFRNGGQHAIKEHGMKRGRFDFRIPNNRIN